MPTCPAILGALSETHGARGAAVSEAEGQNARGPECQGSRMPGPGQCGRAPQTASEKGKAKVRALKSSSDGPAAMEEDRVWGRR